MYGFLVPLLVGFGFNLASTFTTAHSRRWGERAGRRLTFALRVLLGMPLWILGLILAIRASSAPLLGPYPALEILAWFLVAAGVFPMTLGLAALGSVAAMPSVRSPLIHLGAYAHVRHPIYAGMLLEFLGIGLQRTSPEALLACSLGLAWIVAQARLEERDLLERLPSYRDYLARVPAFFPRIPPGG